MTTDYVICIPSYKRAVYCNQKTLQTLHENNIDAQKINVYVANEEEYEIYKANLNKCLYNELIIGKERIVFQRDFIMCQYAEGQNIVFIDDDIENIDLSISEQFKDYNLDYFIRSAFDECLKTKSYIWGVYPVFNSFFRKSKKEISMCLNYIVGAFYGIINRPNLKSIELAIASENGQKEDVERTLKYFIEDGKVIRFNKIGFKTKYYGKEGGLGNFESRLKPMAEACQKLEEMYSKYGKTKVRKNGMSEFILKKKLC